ncbi:hypothetical protein [Leminorella grimontii]|uniref:hypothetical protein n=1 Tax=Leminorella grimontii TaxID=82981 RepID=UPI00321FE6A9
MKKLNLNDVMAYMKVTITETGYEISSPAGSAQYDAWGSRTTVNGIPEHFPRSLTVKQPKAEKVISTLIVEVKPKVDESALVDVATAIKAATERAATEILSRLR